jgi:hypothetical protein
VGGLAGLCFLTVFGLLLWFDRSLNDCRVYFALAAAISLGRMHVVIQRVMRR